MPKKKKLLFVFGTRPEALKLAPVILKAKADKRFQTFVCLTAQHRQMVDQVLGLFRINPDFDLNIMQPSQTLGDLTHRLFEKIHPVFLRVKPDWVIVQGDTTSAFAIALKAFYEKIKVAHVEAGLRSFNKYHPFPEEINRVMISRLADVHFPPTPEASSNLRREGISKNALCLTGNTVVDALRMIQPRLRADHLPQSVRQLRNQRFILVTAHRRENLGKPLASICLALKKIVRKFPDVSIVYPVHLNPSVQKTVRKYLGKESRVILIPPADYLEFTALLNACCFALTDSGGVQEEAPSFHKPVLVMREVTERPDGVKLGIAKLVGTSRSKIVEAASSLLTSKEIYKKMIRSKNPYGDGRASERILRRLAAS